MKLRKRCVQLIILTLIIYPILISIRKLTSIGMITHISPIIDTKLSLAMREQIIHQIHQYKYTTYNPSALIDHLKMLYPFVSSITIQPLASHIAVLELQAKEPILCLNSDSILLSPEVIVCSSAYALNVTSQLNLLSVVKLMFDQPSILFQIAQQAYEKDLFKRCNIFVETPHTVFLQDKAHHGFSIVCDSNKLPEEYLLQLCDVLKEKVCNEPSDWMADIRFKDQIILKRGARGKYEKV